MDKGDVVVLMKVAAMVFVVALGVGVLFNLPSVVSAGGPEHAETIHLAGPHLDGHTVTIGNDQVVLTNKRLYNGISILPNAGQSVKVDLAWEEVGKNLVASTNEFNFRVEVDGVVIKEETFKGTSSFQGLLFTTPGTYKIILTGKQGITKYAIVVDELP